MENNNKLLADLKTQLSNLVNECESIYSTYSEKRDTILELKTPSYSDSSWKISSDNWQTAANSWNDVPENTADWNSSSTPAPTGTIIVKFLN